MNTLNGNLPKIKQGSFRDYVIVNEDLEFAFNREQLNKITELHNDGFHIEEISKRVRRNVWEVLQAIIHQCRQGVEMRPIAYKKKG